MFPVELYKQALEQEFALSYIGNMGSIQSWQSVLVGERDWHYKKLVEMKMEEKKRADEDKAKMDAQRQAAKSRRR